MRRYADRSRSEKRIEFISGGSSHTESSYRKCSKKIVEEIKSVYDGLAANTDLVVTPELSLTGYTCEDLFQNRNLLDLAKQGICDLAKYTCQYGACGAALVVGVPIEKDGELFNCAALLQNGKIIAIVPKTYLPNYAEFYEKRWFSGGNQDAQENCAVLRK